MTRYGFRLVLRGSTRVQPVRGSFATIAEARAAGEAAAAGRSDVREIRAVSL